LILGDYNWIEPREAFPKAREFAFKAIEIDPRLAEPHVSLGAVYNSYEGLWLKSEEEFKKAIELRPSYATAHMWYGLLLLAMQRFEESYKRMEQAGELDPLSRVVKVNLGSILTYMGRAREAIQRLEELLQAEPDHSLAHVTLGGAYLLDSRVEEAIYESRKALALAGGDSAVKADIACLLALAGKQEEANGILQELIDPFRTTWVSAIKIAQVLFALDRIDDAFNHLDKALEEKSVFLNHGGVFVDLRTFPWFYAARRDPRWRAFLQRVGISSPQSST
jgi:tetratricopeptide (TPR) repeat protein